MALDISNDEIRDTNKHTYPINVDSDTNIFQYVNNLDAEVTITVYGTYADDDTFTDKHEIGSTTISANQTASAVLADPWDQLQLESQATSSPTSGELIIKLHQ
jgi:hypothetical protein